MSADTISRKDDGILFLKQKQELQTFLPNLETTVTDNAIITTRIKAITRMKEINALYFDLKDIERMFEDT